MTVMLDGEVIRVSGDCGVEEAETLFNLLQGDPDLCVDLSAAGTVHTALWQVLLMLSPPLRGRPEDPFARQWIMPAVQGGDGRPTTT